MEDGLPSGFVVDLVREAGAAVGLRVEVSLGPWADVRRRFDRGELDVIALSYSEARDKNVDFTAPFAAIEPVFFVRADSPAKSQEDLQGKVIGVQLNDIMYETLLAGDFTQQLVAEQNVPDLITNLSAGKYDAILLFSEPQGLYISNRLDIKNVRPISSTFPISHYSFAVADGNDELKMKLNEGLNILRHSGEYDQIYANWFAPLEQKIGWDEFRFLILAFIAILVLLVGSVIWSRVLEVVVKQRTRDLEKSEQNLRKIIDYFPMPIMFGEDGAVTYINERFKQTFGYTLDDIPRVTDWMQQAYDEMQIREDIQGRWDESYQRYGLSDREILAEERPIICKDRTRKPVMVHSAIINGNAIVIFNDLTERRQIEKLLYLSQASILSSQDSFFWLNPDGKIAFTNEAACRKLGYTREELLQLSIKDIDKCFSGYDWPSVWDQIKQDKTRNFQSSSLTKEGIDVPVQVHAEFIQFDGQEYLFVYMSDITERKKAEDALRLSEEKYSAAFKLNPAAILLTRFEDGTILEVNDAFEWITGFSRDEVVGRSLLDLSILPGKETFTWMADKVMGEETVNDYGISFQNKYADWRAASIFATKLVVQNQAHLLITVQDLTDQKMAEAEMNRQVEHLSALRKIDAAINNGFNQTRALDVVIEQVMEQLQPDAAEVLVVDPETGMMNQVAWAGFQTMKKGELNTCTLEEISSRSAIDLRKTIWVTRLTEEERTAKNEFFKKEKLVTCYVTPLITRDEEKGVLQVYFRRPYEAEQSWIDFFETIAGQAAIAIDDSQLFEILQRKNRELQEAYGQMEKAYSDTLDGWARALELRDRETEGHTRRVTDLTLKLAKQFGFSAEELNIIERGALLHDIGKLGIPDQILLKPGPLDEHEWEIMRRHPGYAQQLLSSTEFLKASLDIPYCHHERWDGSGYPQGLKGEEIPLSARIFAVVDVWDALTNDRPYRSAWTREQTLAYLREQAGILLDPKVVEEFEKMII